MSCYNLASNNSGALQVARIASPKVEQQTEKGTQ